MFNIKEYKKRYYQKYKVKWKNYRKKWRESEKGKEYNKKYRLENKEKLRKEIKKWREDNREYLAFRKLQKDALRYNAEGSHTFEEWLDLKAKCGFICQKCGLKEPFENQHYKFLTQDHIKPLSRKGSDYIENIQPLCARCNSIKGNKIVSQSKKIKW